MFGTNALVVSSLRNSLISRRGFTQATKGATKTSASRNSWPTWGDEPTSTESSTTNKFSGNPVDNNFNSAAPLSPEKSRSPLGVNYVIYKGKAALSWKLIPCQFSKANNGGMIRSKEGAMLLEFAPIGNNPREYDWKKKATFSLSPTECGEIIAMDNSKGLEFLHDPNAGTSQARSVIKRLKVQPTQDSKGVFMSLQVTEPAQGNTLLSVPVTIGELEVIRCVLRSAIPKLLGFDRS